MIFPPLWLRGKRGSKLGNLERTEGEKEANLIKKGS